jgi:hypothetical protein
MPSIEQSITLAASMLTIIPLMPFIEQSIALAASMLTIAALVRTTEYKLYFPVYIATYQ